MKKLHIYSILALGVTFASCSSKTSSPEDEARNYGQYFVEKMASGQLDSIQVSYPDIVKADSLVALNPDTIIVETVSPTEYGLTLAEGTTLKLNRSDEGAFTVVESRGLFAFPADKLEIAKSTGMLTGDENDVQTAVKLADDEFFLYIKEKSAVSPSSIIKVGKLVITQEWDGGAYPGEGYYLLTNTTSSPINGSDYQILMKIMDPIEESTIDSWSDPGKDIAANGSVKIPVTFHGFRGEQVVKGVKFKLSDEELKARFAPSTGNEYQDYLKTKK